MTPVRSSPTRRSARIAATGLLAFGAFGYAVAPAGAAPLPASANAGPAVVAPRHTAVVSIAPADGAVLDRAPTDIVLTFNEKISPQYAQVVLSRDGSPLTIADPIVTGEVLRVALTETTPGAYRIAYRVVSADGHPVSGESRYTVKGALATASSTSTPQTATATSTPSITASAGPSTPAVGTQQPSDQPANHVPGVLIGGGLVAVAAGLLWWDRRRRQERPAGP